MNGLEQSALFLIIMVPLLGALLTVFLPKERPADAWYFSIGVAVICLLLSIYVFISYDYGAGGFQLARAFQWLEDPINISLSLGVDGVSAPLVLLNGLVLLGAVLISQTIRVRTRDFFVLHHENPEHP